MILNLHSMSVGSVHIDSLIIVKKLVYITMYKFKINCIFLKLSIFKSFLWIFHYFQQFSINYESLCLTQRNEL